MNPHRTFSGDIKKVGHGAAEVGRAVARHRGAIVRTAGVVAAGALLVTGYERAQENADVTASMEALQQSKHADNHVYVLSEGANIRRSPMVDDGEIGNNLVEQVGAGKVRIVREPVDGPKGWVGFSLDADPTNAGTVKTLEERAAETVWVKLDELQATGYAHETAYQGVQAGETIPISFTSDGQLHAGSKQRVDNTIATSMEFSADAMGAANFILTGDPANH